MIVLVWEPHHRTGGGALVRVEPHEQPAMYEAVTRPRGGFVQWVPPFDPSPRWRGGGRARRRYPRPDLRVRMPRAIELIAREWCAGPDGWRVFVFATEEEHRADGEAIRRALLRGERNGFRNPA